MNELYKNFIILISINNSYILESIFTIKTLLRFYPEIIIHINILDSDKSIIKNFEKISKNIYFSFIKLKNNINKKIISRCLYDKPFLKNINNKYAGFYANNMFNIIYYCLKKYKTNILYLDSGLLINKKIDLIFKIILKNDIFFVERIMNYEKKNNCYLKTLKYVFNDNFDDTLIDKNKIMASILGINYNKNSLRFIKKCNDIIKLFDTRYWYNDQITMNICYNYFLQKSKIKFYKGGYKKFLNWDWNIDSNKAYILSVKGDRKRSYKYIKYLSKKDIIKIDYELIITSNNKFLINNYLNLQKYKIINNEENIKKYNKNSIPLINNNYNIKSNYIKNIKNHFNNLIIIDNGYIKENKYKSFIYYINNKKYILKKCPSDRFKELKINLCNININNDGYILILGDLPWDIDINLNKNYNIILNKLFNKLRKNTNKKILFRYHPLYKSNKDSINYKIDIPDYIHIDKNDNFIESIKNSYVCISYNSKYLIDSIINGVPIICLNKECVIYELAKHSINNLEKLYIPDKKNIQVILNNICYMQWSLYEIKIGLPFYYFEFIIKKIINEKNNNENNIN